MIVRTEELNDNTDCLTQYTGFRINRGRFKRGRTLLIQNNHMFNNYNDSTKSERLIS